MFTVKSYCRYVRPGPTHSVIAKHHVSLHDATGPRDFILTVRFPAAGDAVCAVGLRASGLSGSDTYTWAAARPSEPEIPCFRAGSAGAFRPPGANQLCAMPGDPACRYGNHAGRF